MPITKMNEKEVRCLHMEVRAEENDQEAIITGYPIVFNQETDLGYFRELIEPSAVSDPKLLKDVALLVGHDFGMIPLAHSRNNNGNSTMRLSPDDYGVNMRAVLDPVNNPRSAEAYSAVKRGDITGMSFAFIVNEDVWEGLDTDKPLRRITSFGDILEVSLVAFPAYKGTTVQAASEGDALESAIASLESAKKQFEEDRAAQAEAERRTAVLERLSKLKEAKQNV